MKGVVSGFIKQVAFSLVVAKAASTVRDVARGLRVGWAEGKKQVKK